MRRILFNSLIAFFGLFILCSSDNSNASFGLTDDSLFSSDACLQLAISSEFSKILNNIDRDTAIHPGKIWYFEKNGNKRIFDVKIRIRGRFRRNSENCDFPPFEIEFQPSQVKETIFQNQKKLKLVTHCRSRRNLFEQYLLQEYLIYKTYNLFTDLSYRVRLASITYSDNEEKLKSFTKYAFFIENTAQLARRCNTERLHVQYIFPDNTDSVHVNTLSVFQYFIGNTDWSIPALHNIIIVRKKPSGPIYAIPYDFEWSGIMNTIYARPQTSLGLSSVRERLFRGFCRSPQEFENTFEIFRKNKEEIYRIYKNQEGIENSQLKQALEYIDEFYKVINNPNLIKKEFLEKCRN
jgi:hypothetical protein